MGGRSLGRHNEALSQQRCAADQRWLSSPPRKLRRAAQPSPGSREANANAGWSQWCSSSEGPGWGVGGMLPPPTTFPREVCAALVGRST